MTKPAIAALLLALTSIEAAAQVNAGGKSVEPGLPFTLTQVTTFNLPWRIAFLPDGRMLITEKVGPRLARDAGGRRRHRSPNVPAVLHQGQGGMLGVFVSPRYATDRNVYLTYSEPGDGGSSLALARAKLSVGKGAASLDGLEVHLAPDAEGPGRAVRRADRVLAGRPVPVSHGRRPAAHDARAGSQSGARQDSSADARRQACAGQSDGRQDRRGKRSADRSAARHRAGEDRAGGQHVHVPRTESRRLRKPGAAVIARRTAWRSDRMAVCGKSSTVRGAATS